MKKFIVYEDELDTVKVCTEKELEDYLKQVEREALCVRNMKTVYLGEIIEISELSERFNDYGVDRKKKIVYCTIQEGEINAQS